MEVHVLSVKYSLSLMKTDNTVQKNIPESVSLTLIPDGTRTDRQSQQSHNSQHIFVLYQNLYILMMRFKFLNFTSQKIIGTSRKLKVGGQFKRIMQVKNLR